MRLAVVILAHDLPTQVVRLIEMMRHPSIRIYLHVDRRASLECLSRSASDPGVTLLERYATEWGGAGLIDAGLAGLRSAFADGCDYFVELTGQDLPIRPLAQIVDFFEAHRDSSFADLRPNADSSHRYGGRDRTEFYAYTVRGRRELCVPKGEDTSYMSVKGKILNAALRARGLRSGPRRHPTYIRPYSGHAPWNLSRDAAEYILAFVAAHPDYREYHEHTLAGDEMFFNSILAGASFSGLLTSDSLRYKRWEGTRSAVLTQSDLPAMLQSGKPFARKFDERVDADVIASVERLHATGFP